MMAEPIPFPRDARRPLGGPLGSIDAEAILGAIASATVVVDPDLRVRYANGAAEQLFQSSEQALLDARLTELLPPSGTVMDLVTQAAREGSALAAHGLTIDTPRTGARDITINIVPVPDRAGWLVISLQEQTRAIRIGQQLEHRNAARSMTAMAAMLAHEVKNPLSGIRGAAQLLQQSVVDDDKRFAQLILDECDRIVALVNRVQVFSDGGPLVRSPVNIHAVLERVRRAAEAGFARGLKFVERYDPSLPAVDGNHDQLVQVFMNLVKNAAEAAPRKSGEIVLATSYQPGVRIAVPGSANRIQLPLVVTIQDNGPGIPDDVKPHLFEPFITSKPRGSGLGLALVAKIISDHGGVVEFESEPRRTVFRVRLQILAGEAPPHA